MRGMEHVGLLQVLLLYLISHPNSGSQCVRAHVCACSGLGSIRVTWPRRASKLSGLSLGSNLPLQRLVLYWASCLACLCLGFLICKV